MEQVQENKRFYPLEAWNPCKLCEEFSSYLTENILCCLS
jgi:hypothetical protein